MEEDCKARDGWRKSLLSWLPHIQLTTGVVLTVLISLVVSAPALIKVDKNDDVGPRFDLEPGSLGSTTVYRLFIYIYFHEDFSSLVCSFLMIWFFGGGFEENVGTAKFCLITPVFAVSSGLLYLAILATGLSWQAKVTVQGFTSVAFAMLSVFTTRSCFKRMLFFGFMVPTKVLPLLFLVLALFLPHAPFLSNVCGILVGIACILLTTTLLPQSTIAVKKPKLLLDIAFNSSYKHLQITTFTNNLKPLTFLITSY